MDLSNLSRLVPGSVFDHPLGSLSPVTAPVSITPPAPSAVGDVPGYSFTRNRQEAIAPYLTGRRTMTSIDFMAHNARNGFLRPDGSVDEELKRAAYANPRAYKQMMRERERSRSRGFGSVGEGFQTVGGIMQGAAPLIGLTGALFGAPGAGAVAGTSGALLSTLGSLL